MTAVFIAGSMQIKNLDIQVRSRIDGVISSGFEIIVGDADGADTAVQAYLFKCGVRTGVTVYVSGAEGARNNIGDWPTYSVETKHASGSRAFYTAKDIALAEAADYGLMIWDSKSTGTLSNVIELLRRRKKSVVFVNKEKFFATVGDVVQLEALVAYMSESARAKANVKLQLAEKISTLKQTLMF